MLIFRLGQVEGELIVNSQIVVTGIFNGVSIVVIDNVATFTFFSDNSFGCAVTFPAFVVAFFGLPITLTRYKK